MADAFELDALWEEFHRVVNMTSTELAARLQVSEAGGHAEAPPPEDEATGLRVLAVLQKRRTDLTEDDAGVMWEVVDAVDAQRGPGHGPAAEDPARRRRLMALGHDPLRA
ncbi:DUF3140 domain-containing protein [Streptomyces sp. SBST2-5]|uniref:DUF3140 domain-containing protein n=1 Tax=Streptomyces composti TaxID=2720025 RepID=A0ABX1A6L6_9ACTN|nr:DUF3140 domain-containing protein [Streptomyces composti]NJP52098.1 DUF3140 domain-containing protein [Streptomyces composti]